jgi:hypothetical protein
VNIAWHDAKILIPKGFDDALRLYEVPRRE